MTVTTVFRYDQYVVLDQRQLSSSLLKYQILFGVDGETRLDVNCDTNPIDVNKLIKEHLEMLKD